MYPVGMLFGLGFDTATEIALLAISVGAVQSGQFPLWAVMIFPLLFTAGMCLMDTLQNLLMLRVYDWAIADDNRSLQLNTVVTGASMLLALGIAGLRWSDLAGMSTVHAGLAGSNVIGILVTGVLVAVWLAARHRRRRGDTSAVLNSPRE
jgi:high-affinity nickel-transport protein